MRKSGWPSGLRRQTQGCTLPALLSVNKAIVGFWSTNVGVGSNPTSDIDFYSIGPVLSFIAEVFLEITWWAIEKKNDSNMEITCVILKGP